MAFPADGDVDWSVRLETPNLTVFEYPHHYHVWCRLNGETTIEFDMPKLGYNFSVEDVRLALSVIERIEDRR
jgi:hypothetical protein